MTFRRYWVKESRKSVLVSAQKFSLACVVATHRSGPPQPIVDTCYKRYRVLHKLIVDEEAPKPVTTIVGRPLL